MITNKFASIKRRIRFFIIILIALMTVVSIVTILNAAGLQDVLTDKTSRYINDVSYQVSLLVDTRFNKILSDLSIVAESIDPSEEENLINANLEQKKNTIDFELLAFYDVDGHFYQTEGEDVSNLNTSSIESALSGKTSIAQITGTQYIIYTTPVYDGRNIIGVVFGIKDLTEMQEILDTGSFEGYGSSVILDQNGDIVLIPAYAEFSDGLSFEFASAESDEWAIQMMADLKNGAFGEINLTRADGTGIIGSYYPLSHNNWFVFTMVPSDIISQDTDAFAQSTFTVTFVMIGLFTAILFAIMYMQRENQKSLEEMVFVDPVTAGPSGIRFRLDARKLIDEKPLSTYIMVAMDIHNFKLINDFAGIEQGDRTLKYIYKVLKRSISKSECVARSSADIFYLLIKILPEDKLIGRIESIIADINSFNKDKKDPYYLAFRSGFYVVSDSNVDIITMQDHANAARKNITTSGFAFYDDAMRTKSMEEKIISDSMEIALENNEFVMYLQPKVQLPNLNVHGAEALVRWLHPKKGLIPPFEFIPIFEKSGFIRRVDLYIFEQACKALRQWQDEDKELLTISVNMSRQHLKSKNFLEDFLNVWRKYDIPAHFIELEFTETIMFSDDELLIDAREAVDAIHAAGFKCSIDDFGWGYSSLSTLKNLSVDTLKIDGRFFRKEGFDSNATFVIETIVDLANKLNMETVAEGVEHKEQVSFLSDIGCDLIQGYVFSRPLPLDEFVEFAFDKDGKNNFLDL